MRKLFIINSTSLLGGSTQSLRNLIECLDEKIDIIAPKNGTVSNREIKNFFGSNVNKVYRYYLPFRTSFVCSEGNLREWLEKEFAFRQNRRKILDFIIKNKYDFVYLNSYTLYPLITSKYAAYIHVRELCNANMFLKTLLRMKFRNARGIIYIDYATEEALGIKRNSIVLNNPFNQKTVLDVDLKSVRDRFSIKEQETVFLFACLGDSSEKGMAFIADAFVRAACQDGKLLLVGVKKMSQYEKYHNIIFLERTAQMDELYAVSDYVLRGESRFCIGRTIYEALYSGCSVMIPGMPQRDSSKIFEYDKFKNEIFFYMPRDTDGLVKLIRERVGKKKESVLGLSNVEKYAEQFNKFIAERTL